MSQRLRAQLGLVSALGVLITSMLVLIRGSIDSPISNHFDPASVSHDVQSQATQLANTTR